MKNALQIRTLTTAIAICVASAIVAQSSAEGEAETMSETPQTRNLAVPGASIYVEQRGSGPTLLLISGGAQDAGVFDAGEVFLTAIGEAVVVEVLPGRYLFALLDGGDNYKAAATAWAYAIFKLRDYLDENEIPRGQFRATIKSEPRDTPIPLPPKAMPRLVTFDDISDPTTVHLVDPANLSASFGPGVSLAGVTLEITGADVTEGRVEAVLRRCWGGFVTTSPKPASAGRQVPSPATLLRTSLIPAIY